MTPPTTPRTPAPSVGPLAIWPVAQTTAQWQRAGRYLPACTAHPGKMLPELARRNLDGLGEWMGMLIPVRFEIFRASGAHPDAGLRVSGDTHRPVAHR